LCLLAHVGHRQIALRHPVAKDALQQDAQLTHVVSELGKGRRRQHRPHCRSRRKVAAAEVHHLGADVQCQPLHRIVEPAQGLAKFGQEFFSLIQRVRDEKFLDVRVVVVDGGATHAGVPGHICHGQPGQAVGEEELAEGGEDAALGVRALLGVAGR
jgi:hypothetical protein